MDFIHKVAEKYTPVQDDVTYAKKVMALEDALNTFVTPYHNMVAGHVGAGIIKVVKEDEWFLPAPAIRLTEANVISVLARDGTEICSTNKIDEALGVLDSLLLEYIE